MLELQVYHIPWCLWCKPPGNLVCTCDVILFRSHSSDCRKRAEYMVRHSSVSLSVITFSTQNILELYFGRWKVIFWLIIGALFIVTVAFHFKWKTRDRDNVRVSTIAPDGIPVMLEQEGAMGAIDPFSPITTVSGLVKYLTALIRHFRNLWKDKQWQVTQSNRELVGSYTDVSIHV